MYKYWTIYGKFLYDAQHERMKHKYASEKQQIRRSPSFFEHKDDRRDIDRTYKYYLDKLSV